MYNCDFLSPLTDTVLSHADAWVCQSCYLGSIEALSSSCAQMWASNATNVNTWDHGPMGHGTMGPWAVGPGPWDLGHLRLGTSETEPLDGMPAPSQA